MRISLGLPPTHHVSGEGGGSTTIGDLGAQARAAESAGVDAVFVTDHPSPLDAWVGKGGHNAFDPLVALSFVAASTSAVALHTNLYVPAYRHPRLTASGVATLEHLSGGRVILGVGAGYLEDEFVALEADFARRGDRTDEAMVLGRRLWTGESVDGRSVFPPPVRAGGPPIWVGGNSRRAARRAAELGDGWSPFPVTGAQAARMGRPEFGPDQLAEGIALIGERSEALGRATPVAIAYMVPALTMFASPGWDAAEVLEEASALAAAGVTWLVAALPARSETDWYEQVDRLPELLSGLHAMEASP
ncbi:LLM class F420-dependent oxidoreductase [soil metagenome]